MPGVASLNARQYYAHPQNAFWPIINQLYGNPSVDPATLSYSEKTALLLDGKVAVWDVLAECQREGSLDSKIIRDTARCNNFSTFLHDHNRIVKIGFNGKAAEQLFRKLALPDLKLSADIVLTGLPSSSPAMARLSRSEKTQLWRQALCPAESENRQYHCLSLPIQRPALSHSAYYRTDTPVTADK